MGCCSWDRKLERARAIERKQIVFVSCVPVPSFQVPLSKRKLRARVSAHFSFNYCTRRFSTTARKPQTPACSSQAGCNKCTRAIWKWVSKAQHTREEGHKKEVCQPGGREHEFARARVRVSYSNSTASKGTGTAQETRRAVFVLSKARLEPWNGSQESP